MESCEYTVMAAGPERDEVIVKNWRQQWLANGRPSGAWTADQMEKMMAYVAGARAELQHQSFVAVSRSGEVVGSAACQLWSGPMPTTHERVGTCWGVFVKPEWRRKGVATQLMRSTCDHWRSIGCQRGVLLCASDEARRVYERLGFGAGNMLQHDLSSPSEPTGDLEHLVVEPAGADADGDLLRHWRLSLIKAGGWASEVPDNQTLEANAAAFISRARDKLEFQSFVARDPTGAVVGSASCQVWEGPGSNNASWQKLIKIGVVWNLYVAPEYRERGVEAKLLERVVSRWKEIRCTKGLSMALCNDDAAVLARLGFTPKNAMVVELSRASSLCSPIDLRRVEAARPTATRATGALLADDSLTHEELSFNASVRKSSAELALTMSDAKLASLRLALPQMIDAALPDSKAGAELKEAVVAAQREVGVHVSGDWYTQRIVKFGGGFDMKKLTAQPGKLAEKFDRLSTKYDEWSVGNRCSYYDWLARMSASAGSSLLGSGATVLDVACGIGLPGHMLQLCGFEASIAGTDISSGMLEQARRRRVYDRLFVANANEGLDVAPSSVDLVVCVGAMELLDHAKVLAEFARILKPGGRLWATFQWEGAIDDEGNALAHPTAHQNVAGVTLEQLTAELAGADFDVGAATIEKTTCAFLTPSPAQDGSVLPVPYLYVSAGLAA